MLTHFWPEKLPEKYVAEAKTVFPKTIAADEGLIIDFPKIQKKKKV